MNATESTVDVDAIVSEIVRVMFQDGIGSAGATMEVITRRKDLCYGQSAEWARIADEKFKIIAAKHPELARHVKGYRRQKHPFFSHAAITHQMLAQREA